MIPARPKDARRSESHMDLRYEDVAQDGRLRTVAMPHGLAKAFWATSAVRRLGGLRAQGVLPILNRMCCEVGDGPLGLQAGIEAEAHHDLAHVAGADGRVERIVLQVWATLRAPRDVVYGPPPARAGEIIEVGRVYAEHVFTRLFAPPGERRVLALADPRLPAVPTPRLERTTPASVLALPPDAAWTGDWQLDTSPVVLGLDHTDSNQHVNSLVYPQLLRDAALRAWGAAATHEGLRICADELLFRKPCFAGERLQIALRTFAHRDRVGAVLALLPLGELRADIGHWADTDGRTYARVVAAPSAS